jgi:iron complex outermembrane receptor protein
MINRSIKIGLFLSAACGALCTSTMALAQGADEGATGDIIVTARRSEERLQDVPISISVFTPQAISDRNVVTSSDLAIYTPSLSINQRFGPEKAAFQIRGFNQDNSTAPTVGTYFADVVAPRVQGGTAGGGVAPVGSFMDLQNVQVLKGPQGTLFGRNTTGGAVLLVPTKPTDRLEGWVEGSAGDYGMWRAQAVLNVPLADTFKVRMSVDRNHREGYMKNHSGIGTGDYNDVNYFYARLSIVADLTPDLENYTVAHYSNSFGKNYGSRIVACNPNATAGGIITGVNPAGTTSVVGSGALFTATPACDQLARQNARGDGPLDVEINNPDPYMHIQQWQIINTTTWRASDSLTVKNIASYSEYRERGQFSLNGDNFTSNFGILNGNFPPPPSPIRYPVGAKFAYILLAPQPGDNQAAESTFTEELQFQGQAGNLTWQAGGYMEISNPIGFNQGYTAILVNCPDPQNLNCQATFPGASSVSGSATKFSFRNHGLYAQGTYKFTDQLSLTAGIRYTWDKTSAFSESVRLGPQPSVNGVVFVQTCNDVVHFFGKNAAGVPTPGVPLVVTSRDQCKYGPPDQKSDKPTWLIDLDYKPMPDLLLYAKYARGYRAGGLNLTTVGYEGFGPEKVDAYEVGAKYSFRGAVSGYFNLAGFYNNFSDMQIQVTGISSVPGFSGAVPEVNAGKARIWGIEVDSSVTLFEHLRFDLGYTYLDTKLQDIVIPAIPAGAPYSAFIPTALKGGPLAQSPKNRVTLTGTYTLPLDESIGEISFGATFIHTDSQIFTQATLAPGDPIYRTYTNGTPLPPQVASFMPANPDLRYEPATNILNLNVNWNKVLGSPVDAAFFMTNVTNEIYPVGIGQSWTSAGFESLLYGAPRMWGFRLRYSFGQ